MILAEKEKPANSASSKTSQKRFTTEAQRAQRKNFIVSCAGGAANNKS